MENMFKRTLLGAAIATAAMASTGANAAIDLLDGKVQMYGQAAGFVQYGMPKADKSDDTVSAVIESRIGFRGAVEFDNFAPTLLWQIEGGNADNGGYDPNESWKHPNNGALGARDTFLGFQFDGIGSIKYGRQLVAAYNYVDWPHSNPGLGNVFDWNQDIGASFEDRTNNNLRFDSANFGGFNVQATLSNMATSTDNVAYSIAASYSADMFSVHAGYYDNSAESVDADKPWLSNTGSQYSIFGGSLFLGDITLTAAGKYMTTDATAGDNSQWAWSTTAQYVYNGQWVYKVGYAGTSEADIAGKGKQADTDDTAITARLGYLLPSAYLFTDIRHYNMNGGTEGGDSTNLLMGVEYYF
ncbi:Chitoporin precursor [Photobacterium malacitanum]|uniref:Chitoporin n=1 Tax=Photobacterium malacitanum TaxID=2204294 RepID=A0A1Y6MDG4_9GAMM|nr:porin [Photobacterium malacitanum]SMY33271.1 Chitoporin precursor [Photobacterium malacitanum]